MVRGFPRRWPCLSWAGSVQLISLLCLDAAAARDCAERRWCPWGWGWDPRAGWVCRAQGRLSGCVCDVSAVEGGCHRAPLQLSDELLLWHRFNGKGEILTHPMSAERRGSVCPDDWKLHCIWLMLLALRAVHKTAWIQEHAPPCALLNEHCSGKVKL